MSEQQINRSFQEQSPLLEPRPHQNHTPGPEPALDSSVHRRTLAGLQRRSRKWFGPMLGSVGLLLLLLAAQAAGAEGRSRLTLRTTKTWSPARPQGLKTHSCQEEVSVGQEVLVQGLDLMSL